VDASSCPFSPLGVLGDTPGPLFWAGLNLEHSLETELVLAAGSTNVVLAGLQTEQSSVGLLLNATRNAVVFGSLHAFWPPVAVNQSTPTQALASRPTAAPPPAVDVSYRIYGLGVPAPVYESALFVDDRRFEVPLEDPTAAPFAAATAVLNA
jgi:hypothetical protein